MVNKRKSRYKQKAKIGDWVICIGNGAKGVIKQIDNVCNIRDNDRTVNEYYVYWPVEEAWTRHDCYHLDNDVEVGDGVRHLTGVREVLFGNKK